MQLHLRFAIGFMLITAIGCGGERREADLGPFGPANESPLLAPFAGKWMCNFEKTVEARKAAGDSDEKIDRLRKIHQENPEFAILHPDIDVTGDVVLSDGTEYRLFSMHQHGDKVCGKAWFHEDRFDPGDMSKCYVRLVLKDGDLLMDVRMQVGYPDTNDPDMGPSLAAEGGSAEECDADNLASKTWTDWSTYVFSRKR